MKHGLRLALCLAFCLSQAAAKALQAPISDEAAALSPGTNWFDLKAGHVTGQFSEAMGDVMKHIGQVNDRLAGIADSASMDADSLNKGNGGDAVNYGTTMSIVLDRVRYVDDEVKRHEAQDKANKQAAELARFDALSKEQSREKRDMNLEDRLHKLEEEKQELLTQLATGWATIKKLEKVDGHDISLKHNTTTNTSTAINTNNTVGNFSASVTDTADRVVGGSATSNASVTVNGVTQTASDAQVMTNATSTSTTIGTQSSTSTSTNVTSGNGPAPAPAAPPAPAPAAPAAAFKLRARSAVKPAAAVKPVAKVAVKPAAAPVAAPVKQ